MQPIVSMPETWLELTLLIHPVNIVRPLTNVLSRSVHHVQALHPRVWRPWPGTAEVVCMSVLALLWIQASVKASREDRRKATAHIIDSVEASAVHTGTAANASYRAKSSLSPKSTYQALPTPISVVFMVLTLLRSLVVQFFFPSFCTCASLSTM